MTVELKESYFRQAARYLAAEDVQESMFADADPSSVGRTPDDAEPQHPQGASGPL